MKTVVVLMSTYNGERFLREQIDSVLAQENVDIQLIVRDDGSCDSTLSILMEYAEKYSNIIILPEKNCGAEMSFHNLCEYAKNNTSADYYAFCDQDDVWQKNKVITAIDKLNLYDINVPNLYFSNLRMVDEQLNEIRNLFKVNEVKISKHMALIQVFVYGCTCVFNRKALEDYCKADFSKELLHDNWIYILSIFLGNVVYDHKSFILYRQHGTNLSGQKVSGFKLCYMRLKRAMKGNWGHSFELFSSMLLQCFKERLFLEDYFYINRIANYKKSLFSKLSLFFSSSYRTGVVIKDIAIKIRILTGNI